MLNAESTKIVPNYHQILPLIYSSAINEVCDVFQDEAGFDQVFQNATFKPYIFKLRAKMETYNVSGSKDYSTIRIVYA